MPRIQRLCCYTRHCPPCNQRDRRFRLCHCPKWIRGVLPNGRILRTSAKTRSWERAEKFARKLETENDPMGADLARTALATVREAVELFLGDQIGAGLGIHLAKEVPHRAEEPVPHLDGTPQDLCPQSDLAGRSNSLSRNLEKRGKHHPPET